MTVSRSPDDVRREIEQTRADLGATLEAIGDQVSPKLMKERAMEKVNDRVDTVNERMNPTRIVRRRTATVRTGIRNVRESVMGAADDAKMAPEVVRGQAQGNPLLAGLVAFGGGLVLATALPPTDNERQAAERIVEASSPSRNRR